ncbi:putative nuclease HARBI1 [Teleopsis dalmanni]|uniref:putative nuclease HARBI1 n=1 Tax=Teleopsis dalmanni TaxID=139649 RepID=UPI0018CF639F|nr:putative nuclease HARBI1 [Teleopsis dalmanni]XP_037932664.1 putative nuclease HARBI1 [Teleopsis dalmanni]
MYNQNELTVQACNLFLNILRLYSMRNQMRNRRWRVRPINVDRALHGYYRKTFLAIKEKDNEEFFSHTRMSKELYTLLLKLIAPSATKCGQQINADERLSLTLLYLAHGVPLQSLAWSYKLGRTTVRNTVLEMCDIIWQLLSPIYLSEPTEEQYRHIASDFWQTWNIPNCVGAIDGKHVAIKCPRGSGSQFFNYKKFFSIVLIAACDAKYTFTSASLGAYGSQSDGGIFRVTRFGKDLAENKLPLPRKITG